MSVRATERLIGDLVQVTSLPNSPQMVVKAINEETKLVTTVWFCDCHGHQEGVFPASALDRAVPAKAPSASKSAGKTAKSRKTAKR